MTLAEKLDFLMTLTATSNSTLGRALSYDASYISRVRAGKRGLPRRQPFVQPAAEYFARKIILPVQQNAAASLLTPGRLSIRSRARTLAPASLPPPIPHFNQQPKSITAGSSRSQRPVSAASIHEKNLSRPLFSCRLSRNMPAVYHECVSFLSVTLYSSQGMPRRSAFRAKSSAHS